jgi:hypothetical protein
MDAIQDLKPNLTMAGGVTNSIGLVINSTNPLSSSNGGTGINNGSNTITLGGNISTGGLLTTASSFTTSGANALTLTTTGSTNVTLPTTGTLVNSAVTTLSSLSSIGTISTGVWNGTVIGPTYGGTGVNNGSNTLTLAGNLATSGANSLTLTTTGTTNVTFPTSGTLATLGSNGVSVTNVTGTSVTMSDAAAINIYVANNASLCTLTLPTTTTVGHIFKIVGAGAGGWKIAQGTSQVIDFQVNGANASTTSGTGGSLSSNLSTDCIELGAIVANTTFTATSMYSGQISYV